MNARTHSRLMKRAIALLRESGAKRIVVEICTDGTTRVVEARDDAGDDEAARLGRLIEERMGNA